MHPLPFDRNFRRVMAKPYPSMRSLLTPRRWFVWMFPAFGLVLVAALWAAVLNRITEEERETRAATMRHTQLYVAAFEQHVRRQLRDAEGTLQYLKAEIERRGAAGLTGMPPVAQAQLLHVEASMISIIDSNGIVVAADKPEAVGAVVADQEYFAALEKGDGTLNVGRPIADLTSGAPVIVLSRRLDATDGSFAGVVALMLEPSVFTDFYLESNLGESGLLALYGTDGFPRARRTGGAAAPLRDAASQESIARVAATPIGTFQKVNNDGVERFVAYRRLPDYPLVVVAAQSTVESLRAFHERRRVYMAATLAATCVILPFFAISTLLTLRLQRRTAQLNQQRKFLEAVLNNVPLGLSLRKYDPAGTGPYLVWNEANAIMFGITSANVLGKAVRDMAPAASANRVLEWDRTMAESPGVQEVVETVTKGDGTAHLIHRLRTPLFDVEDRVEYIVTVSQDITRSRAAEDELRLASKVFETTADGIVISDGEDRIITVNSAFTRLSGFTLEEMVHKSMLEAPFSPLQSVQLAERVARLHREGHVTAEVRRKHRNGQDLHLRITATIVRNDEGRILNYLRVFTDISQLKDTQRRLERLAQIDALTGLPNRRLFGDRLEHAMQRALRTGLGVGLLFLDLDGFKQVNDKYGHPVGDRLLQQAAAKLSGCIRSSDSLCRLGGDEFTIIVEDAHLPRDALMVAQRILQAFTMPFVIGGKSILVGTSIGIGLYPADAGDCVTLIHRADAAMYQAKNAGGHRYAVCGKQPAERTRSTHGVAGSTDSRHHAVAIADFDLLRAAKREPRSAVSQTE